MNLRSHFVNQDWLNLAAISRMYGFFIEYAMFWPQRVFLSPGTEISSKPTPENFKMWIPPRTSSYSLWVMLA